MEGFALPDKIRDHTEHASQKHALLRPLGQVQQQHAASFSAEGTIA